MRIEENGVKTPVNQGQHILFYDGDRASLSCEVVIEGSKESPAVEITIGDKDVSSAFEVRICLNTQYG